MARRPGSAARPTLRAVVTVLRTRYGPQPPPPADDVLGLVLWENVAYLADDERRAKAFRELRNAVGTTPAQILKASDAALRKVTANGILGDRFAEKVREVARIAHDDWDGDADAILALPERKAKRALRAFPGIGEPGAEKILLFTRTLPVLALESNGLRVLVRLGFGEEGSSYAATYAAVRAAVAPEVGDDFDFLIDAHQLLRRHGQEMCRRTEPRCPECVLVKTCAFARRARGSIRP